MGNCLGTDVKSKRYAVGNAQQQDSIHHAEAEAKELAVGTLGHCSWLLLHLECRKLKDVDLLSKSDSVGVLYERVHERWVEAGRTEMVTNSLSPRFVTSFKVLYNFERIQRYKLLMIDVDKGQDPGKVDPAKCTSLGSCEFVLGEVVTAPGSKLVRNLVDQQGGNLQSLMVMLAEEASNSKEVYSIRIAASRLKNVERFGTSDPFLLFSRTQETGEYIPVFKSRVAKNTLSPEWEEMVVRANQLNNGDMVRPLLVQVFDHEAGGKHRLMGECELTTERMVELAAQPGAVVPIKGPRGQPAGDYGTLQIRSFAVQTSTSFLDYLAGGSEIGFLVAVDFTASNGSPTLASSKHYVAGGPTEYEKAIMGIGHVIEYYDHDKVFPMYGFGGRFQGGPANHCFPMGAGPDSNCLGVHGLLQAYRQALSTWQLSGPTLFAPVIRMAIQQARQVVGATPPKYSVLLILTDGVINDMQETVDAIIDAAALPLSILIVGIGQEDFGNMRTLDGDGQALRSGARVAVRDIVQFVEFEKYRGDGARLAQELLAELPGQFLKYMRTHDVVCPRPRPAAATMTGMAAPPQPSAPPLMEVPPAAC